MVKIMDTGRVCYALVGRNAGQKVVVMEVHKQNQVYVVSARGKKQTYSVRQLWPTEQVIKITKNAGEKEIVQALENTK